jgi:hypothetical protein
MRKTLFQINDGPIYMGYTSGARWNGWATPYFQLEEAQKLQAEWSQSEDLTIVYDVTKDAFVCKYEDDDQPYIWEGEDIQTEDGIKHLYGIGAYSHIWDDLDDYDKRYLAQTIDSFLLDYDEGAYEDYHGNRDVEKIIFNKFADIDVFAKAHKIMNDSMLDADAKYIKLYEILKL